MVLFYVFEAVLAAGFLLFRLAINFAPHKFSNAISSEKTRFTGTKRPFHQSASRLPWLVGFLH
jgi:hypothetical protein